MITDMPRHTHRTVTDWILGSWGLGTAETGLFCSKTDLDHRLSEHWYSYLEKVQNPFNHLIYVLSKAHMSICHAYS